MGYTKYDLSKQSLSKKVVGLMYGSKYRQLWTQAQLGNFWKCIPCIQENGLIMTV